VTICVLAMPPSYGRHTLPPAGSRLSGQLGGAFGVGGGDVAHGSAVAEPEQSHEVKGVGPLAGLEEDPVLANLLHGESGAGEGLVEHAGADDWVGGVERGLLGDDQVRLDRGRPAPVPFGEPVGGQLVGEVLEQDDVWHQARTGGEGGRGQVEGGQRQAPDGGAGQGVDVNQGDEEPLQRSAVSGDVVLATGPPASAPRGLAQGR
jgi:hypothetical protein